MNCSYSNHYAVIVPNYTYVRDVMILKMSIVTLYSKFIQPANAAISPSCSPLGWLKFTYVASTFALFH